VVSCCSSKTDLLTDVQDVEDVLLEIRSILYYMQDCVVSRRLHVHLYGVAYGFLMRRSKMPLGPLSTKSFQLS
jgi:hypothetical protein